MPLPEFLYVNTIRKELEIWICDQISVSLLIHKISPTPDGLSKNKAGNQRICKRPEGKSSARQGKSAMLISQLALVVQYNISSFDLQKICTKKEFKISQYNSFDLNQKQGTLQTHECSLPYFVSKLFAYLVSHLVGHFFQKLYKSIQPYILGENVRYYPADQIRSRR